MQATRLFPFRRALLAALLVLCAPGLASAQDEDLPDDPFERLQALHSRIDDANRQHRDLLQQIEESDARRKQLDEIVAPLQAQLAALNADLAAKEKELWKTTAAFVAALRSAALAGERLRSTRARVRARVVGLYKGGPGAFIDALLGARSLDDARLRADYVVSVLQSDRALLDAVRVAEADYRDEADKLETLKSQQTEARNKVAAVQRDIEAKYLVQKKARDVEAAESEHKRSLLDRIDADREAWQELLDQERRDLLRVSGLLNRIQSGQGIPAGVIAGLLAVPAYGEVVSGFGYRVHPIWGGVRFHSGVDIDVPYGDPIHAAAPGTVVDAGWLGGYGNAVVIEHGNGIATLYAHMSALAVEVGDEIDTGRVVGYCGSTGFSTGPHLHFEVLLGGEATDPLPWLGIV